MARIRSLKPEFWTDSKVVGIENPWARLLFMGMWNFAICDSGHVEDDALALKLKILPAEMLDATDLLNDVLKSGMVTREYLPNGTSYLVIGSFPNHAKADARWTPRCSVCAHHVSDFLAETRASFGEPEGEPAGSPELTQGEGLVEGLVEGEENYSANSADAKSGQQEALLPEQRRDDVEKLCRLLVDLVTANGSRKPYVTKKWRDEARLLLDRDKVDPVLAEHVMRWALNDSFWKANIESMPTFRKQFDKLRQKRKAEHDATKGGGNRNRPAQSDQQGWADNPDFFGKETP